MQLLVLQYILATDVCIWSVFERPQHGPIGNLNLTLTFSPSQEPHLDWIIPSWGNF